MGSFCHPRAENLFIIDFPTKQIVAALSRDRASAVLIACGAVAAWTGGCFLCNDIRHTGIKSAANNTKLLTSEKNVMVWRHTWLAIRTRYAVAQLVAEARAVAPRIRAQADEAEVEMTPWASALCPQ
jgi:hypothetical protein